MSASDRLPFFLLAAMVALLPAISEARLLFSTGFEDGNSSLDMFSPQTTGSPATIELTKTSPRIGNFSVKMGRSPSGVSARLTLANLTLGYGKEYWTGFSNMLPSGLSNLAVPVVYWELEGSASNPNCSIGPSVVLAGISGNWNISLRYGGTNSSNDVEYPLWRGGYSRAVWNDWVIHMVLSPRDDGLLEIWKDGTKIAEKKGPNTYGQESDSPAAGNTDKCGLPITAARMSFGVTASKASDPLQRVLYDEIRIGGSDSLYDEVKPGAVPLDRDNDTYYSAVDCNDANSTIYPGANETCNRADDDCDGQIDEDSVCGPPDNDSDGYNSTADCNDTNPRIYPGAAEECDNIDNDCDLQVDENITAPFGADTGICEFGEKMCIAGRFVETRAGRGPETEICNGLDDDCDGQADENLTSCNIVDADNDTYNSAVDCNDANSTIYPGANETCNRADDDCDGESDEGLLCPLNASIRAAKYDGTTTNFSASNLSGINNLTLEKQGKGRIRMLERVSLIRNIDLDRFTDISQNSAYINTTELPELNRSAEILFYNVTFARPVVMRDGDECPDTVCTILNSSGGTITVIVTHFTTYSISDSCEDGTPFGKCSLSKPRFCDGGILADKCSVCGCPLGTCLQEVCTLPENQTRECTESDVKSCGAGDAGECSLGTQACVNGRWSICSGNIDPGFETCDGKDNDCDGQVDEIGCACLDGLTRNCGSNTGICAFGESVCANGQWGPCEGGITAKPREVCGNGEDDTCDGATDEGCEDACTNGKLDEGEEGLDCGGDCSACAAFRLEYVALIAAAVSLLFVVYRVLERRTEKQWKELEKRWQGAQAAGKQ